MDTVNLEAFVAVYREEIIRRCRAKVTQRSPPEPTQAEIDRGVPLFLDQLVGELRHGPMNGDAIRKGATLQGHDLLLEGFTIGQVVHGYGDICQSITELAVELAAPISANDFRTLNRCLDDAIAGAVTEYARDQETIRDGASQELRNLIHIAMVAFEVLKTGNVGIGGSTGVVLHRALVSLRDFADRPVAPVARL